MVAKPPFRRTPGTSSALALATQIQSCLPDRMALHIGRQLLEALLANIRQGVWIGGTDGKAILANSFAESLISESRLPPALESALRGENPPVEECCIRNSRVPQGIWVSLAAKPLTQPDATPFGAVCVLENISEEKAAAPVRGMPARLYRTLFEQNLAGIFRSRLDGTLVECNQAFADMVSLLHRDQLADYRAQFFYDNPADRDHLVSELGTRGEAVREVKMRRLDRTPIWVLLSATLIDSEEDGVAGDVLSTVIDISERRNWEQTLRESEERFSVFMDNLPGIAYVKDADGRYIYCNEAGERVLGSNGMPVKGATAFDLWSPETAERIRQTDLSVIESGIPLEAVETLVQPDGPHTWLISKFPIPESAVGRIGGIGIDITERQLLEERLQQSEKMEAIGRLAGGIAHDFNNLLTLISGYGQMAMDGLTSRAEPERLKPYVEEVLRASSRAAGMTGQLLSFSRRQVVQPKTLDVREVVREAEKMLRRLIGEDIHLVVTMPGEPCPVKADSGQLEQVLINLAVNARDAMPDGGTLRISLSRLCRPPFAEPSGPCVLLEVSDTGKGMDEFTRAHAFEPFYTSKEKGKGTGLGLSTAYGIIRQSGGEITVDSEVNRGARFAIYIPEEDSPVEPPSPQPERAAKTAKNNERVLLVEDESSVRNLVRLMLTNFGYRVVEASSGAEALRIFKERQQPFDLLLTDVIMPNMNGRDLAVRLLEQSPELKVIFMSGYTDDMLARQGVLAQGVVLLKKPFTPETLGRIVRTQLDRK